MLGKNKKLPIFALTQSTAEPADRFDKCEWSFSYLRVVGVEVCAIPVAVVTRLLLVVGVVELLVNLGIGQNRSANVTQ